MLLREVCTPDVVYCSSNTSVLAAARIMRQKHVGDLIVVEDGDGDQTPLGMVTDRDIVVEVLGQERDPSKVLVREIMRTPAVIADETEDTSRALERMQTHGVRRIPIMGENRRLVGVVCLDDLIKRLAADAHALAEIITREQQNEHRGRR